MSDGDKIELKNKVKKVELKISGMTCAMCSVTIKNSISSLDGVLNVDVNLATELATVEYDPEKVKYISLEKAVIDSGYDVVNSRVIIKLGGMTCAMCAKAIENKLYGIEGVTTANVNLSSEKVHVIYNPKAISIQMMRKAIEDVGYQYLGIEGEESEKIEKEARVKDLKSKMIRIVVGFTVGIFLMVLMYIPIGNVSTESISYLSLIIATPTFIFISYPIFSAGYRSLRNRNLNMDVMYSMGIGAAYVSSVMGTFQIILTREFMFYETSVLLASFLMLGRYLEATAKGKTSDAIKKLMGLQPKTALIIRDNVEKEISIEDVQVSDFVITKPGEKIPVDGEVVDGKSYVDESMISGESVPVLKTKGNTLIGGTLNKNSVLKFKATKVGKDTVLSQIIHLVEDAQGTKPPMQKLSDRIVTYFIPTVIIVAIAAFVGWYIIFHSTLLFAITTLISILVIACPCALGLATPTAVTVGIGRGAELGILIKKGEALEVSENITSVVFDKTGTLTKGRPEVTDIVPFGMRETDLLLFAASVEKNSQHPLAEAIIRKTNEYGITIPSSDKFDTFDGKGVIANVNGKVVRIGNRMLLKEQDIIVPDNIEREISNLEYKGKTVIIVAIDGNIQGLIAITDPLKKSAKTAIKLLKESGLKVAMITGDNSRTADSIATQVGIENVIAEVFPQDKAEEVKKLQKTGEIVAFVGDGINDAPALAQADVGIAIGGGTDVAIESGDIVLIREDLTDVFVAIQLSKKVMKRIKENLFWAFAYNVVLIPVAAGILWPLFRITFRPELAGLAMALSSVTVVSLSLLLKRYTPPTSCNLIKNNVNEGHQVNTEIMEKDNTMENNSEINQKENDTSQGSEQMVATDPICKMKVEEKNAKWKSEYNGKTYYFCAPGCKAEFDKNPKKYI